MSEKRSKISTGEDRISSLPDEILHDILARLRDTPKQATKFTVLSKRWAHLYRSYPNLEFSYGDTTEQSLQRFAAAAHTKFATLRQAAETVRIDVERGNLFPVFLDDMFKLAAKISPREVHVSVDPSPYREYTIPEEFSRCCCLQRLQVLTLRGPCIFNCIDNRFGSSLKVLCLTGVTFWDDRLLSGLISGASLLETLELQSILWIPRFRIVDHPSLKTLIISFMEFRNFDISGARSLETLDLYYTGWNVCQVSSTPNLKVLSIGSGRKLTNRKLNELISMIPSLESLILDTPYQFQTPDQLKIVNSSSTKLREIKLLNQFYITGIEIDVPSLINFSFKVNWFKPCPKMLSVQPSSSGRASALLTLDCSGFRRAITTKSNELKKLLVKLSRFRLTLELSFDHDFTWSKPSSDDLPTLLIEHLKVSLPLVRMRDKEAFVDDLFRICLPKCLSFIRGATNHARNTDLVSIDVEYLSKQLMDRAFDNGVCEEAAACKCWRHRLKDVKMVKRVRKGSTRDDEIIDISSTNGLPSVDGLERIWFDLTWD